MGFMISYIVDGILCLRVFMTIYDLMTVTVTDASNQVNTFNCVHEWAHESAWACVDN